MKSEKLVKRIERKQKFGRGCVVVSDTLGEMGSFAIKAGFLVLVVGALAAVGADLTNKSLGKSKRELKELRRNSNNNK